MQDLRKTFRQPSYSKPAVSFSSTLAPWPPSVSLSLSLSHLHLLCNIKRLTPAFNVIQLLQDMETLETVPLSCSFSGFQSVCPYYKGESRCIFIQMHNI